MICYILLARNVKHEPDLLVIHNAKGSFVLRIHKELHRKMNLKKCVEGPLTLHSTQFVKSIVNMLNKNAWVTQIVDKDL